LNTGLLMLTVAELSNRLDDIHKRFPIQEANLHGDRVILYRPDIHATQVDWSHYHCIKELEPLIGHHYVGLEHDQLIDPAWIEHAFVETRDSSRKMTAAHQLLGLNQDIFGIKPHEIRTLEDFLNAVPRFRLAYEGFTLLGLSPPEFTNTSDFIVALTISYLGECPLFEEPKAEEMIGECARFLRERLNGAPCPQIPYPMRIEGIIQNGVILDDVFTQRDRSPEGSSQRSYYNSTLVAHMGRVLGRLEGFEAVKASESAMNEHHIPILPLIYGIGHLPEIKAECSLRGIGYVIFDPNHYLAHPYQEPLREFLQRRQAILTLS